MTFVEGSVTDLDLLMETFPGADGIFLRVAIPSVPRSAGRPSPLAGSTISCRTHTSPDGSVPVHDPWVDPATSPDAPPGLGVPVETLARPWVTFIKGRHHRPPDGDATGHRAGAVEGARRSSPVYSGVQPSLREEAVPEHRPDQITVPVHDRKVILEYPVDLVQVQPAVEVDQNIPKARKV